MYLSVLKDEKLRDFKQLLRDAGFSHNTLRQHLVSLERQGLIIKNKKPIKRRGRPIFVYSLPPEVRHKMTLTINEPQTTIVSLKFHGLRHLCRFEIIIVRWRTGLFDPDITIAVGIDFVASFN